LPVIQAATIKALLHQLLSPGKHRLVAAEALNQLMIIIPVSFFDIDFFIIIIETIFFLRAPTCKSFSKLIPERILIFTTMFVIINNNHYQYYFLLLYFIEKNILHKIMTGNPITLLYKFTIESSLI